MLSLKNIIFIKTWVVLICKCWLSYKEFFKISSQSFPFLFGITDILTHSILFIPMLYLIQAWAVDYNTLIFMVSTVKVEFNFNEAWCNKHSIPMQEHKVPAGDQLCLMLDCCEILLQPNKADASLKVVMNFVNLQIRSFILCIS
jgi:hypothetical protein